MADQLPKLPHGWRMHNSTADISGPDRIDDGSSDDGSDVSDVDIKPDSEGWEDVEDDTEAVLIKCLLCDETFPRAEVMIAHCSKSHNFDFSKIRKDHELDFYGTIKLTNYIRSSVLAGNKTPDTSSPSLWADDKYLQPALEDDALLFSLDDLDETAVDSQ